MNDKADNVSVEPAFANDPAKLTKIRCPHVDGVGRPCNRRLFDASLEHGTRITVRCPKCKNDVEIAAL